MIPSSDNIKSLAKGEVFVFGSNLAGVHGKGAAKQALKFGAKMGEGIGHWGQTYAIPTKDHRLRKLGLESIRDSVGAFFEYANGTPDLTYLVTEVGCGLAGNSPSSIAPMFANPPANVRLPKSFIKILGIKEE